MRLGDGRDRTFFAATIEGELENAQEFSEIAEAKAQARINAALARPMFARAVARSISTGLFQTASSSTETSFKLTHLFGAAHQVTASYAFSGASVSREVLGGDNFSEESARGSSRNRDQSVAASWQAIGSPTFLDEVRLQLARRSIDLTPNSLGALLEIPGIVSMGPGAHARFLPH